MGLAHDEGGLDLALPSYAEGKAFHAMSLDEDRSLFGLSRYRGAREVWFPGVHSDVGGGYPAGERAFSNNALRWMAYHARARNVPLDLTTDDFPSLPDEYVDHDQIRDSWLMWAANSRVMRPIEVGDEVHVSAVLYMYLPSAGFMSYRDIIEAFDELFPHTSLNNDDDWLRNWGYGYPVEYPEE